jgi:hypothetical protein
VPSFGGVEISSHHANDAGGDGDCLVLVAVTKQPIRQDSVGVDPDWSSPVRVWLDNIGVGIAGVFVAVEEEGVSGWKKDGRQEACKNREMGDKRDVGTEEIWETRRKKHD